ncbi:MAG: hypothetical protein OXI57_06875 [Rhodospirillales bacterium]|nr:hypothetical protein [Rhodospirillales bacterium]
MTVGADLPPGAESSATVEEASAVPDADPAYSETSLPLPASIERMPSEAGVETPCTSLLCQMDPATDVVLLTLCVMVCVVATMSVPKLVALLREIAWELLDLFACRR